MKNKAIAKKQTDFYVTPCFEDTLSKLGLTSIDKIFEFKDAENLAKSNIAAHRTRMRFDTKNPTNTFFLKRYDNPPKFTQLKNWILHKERAATAWFDIAPSTALNHANIKTPRAIAFGTQWKNIFEKRSFCITEKIPDAESLEKQLPPYFKTPLTSEKLALKREFIKNLAEFVKKFHDANYRHQDLYLCHIFYSANAGFYLIDLARAFKPTFFSERYRIKDITQLYYSSPATYFSQTDRLRFYRTYTGRKKLSKYDKTFINRVRARARRMARHDIKHNRIVPFAS